MGASETRSQVLPPAWRFTNWEQWSRCVLSRSPLPGRFSLYSLPKGGWSRGLSGNSWHLFRLAAQVWALMSVEVSLSLSLYSFGFRCGRFLAFVSPSSTCTVHFIFSHTPKMLLMDTPEQLFGISFLKLGWNQTMCGLCFVFEPGFSTTHTLWTQFSCGFLLY